MKISLDSPSSPMLNSLSPAELGHLRQAAEAARRQMLTGTKEWPGRPSAQRLALFLAATPDVILRLLDMLDERQTRPGNPIRRAARKPLDGQDPLFALEEAS